MLVILIVLSLFSLPPQVETKKNYTLISIYLGITQHVHVSSFTNFSGGRTSGISSVPGGYLLGDEDIDKDKDQNEFSTAP